MGKERIIDFKTMKDPSTSKYAQLQLDFYKKVLESQNNIKQRKGVK